MEKKANKSRVFQVVIFIISFVAAYFVASYFLGEEEITPNSMLLEHARQENQNLPKMLDAETRLDSLSVENVTLKYHHTLISTKKEASELDFELIEAGMRKIAQENLDSNPVMEPYRDDDVSLQHIFRDKEKNMVFEYTVRHKKEKE
jgi:hypothetical protein